MGTGFAKRKKEAKRLQQQMSLLQDSLSSKLEATEVEGQAGNGLVTLTLSGTGEMKRIRIRPECVDKEDIEGLEALIKAAHQSAFAKVQALMNDAPSAGDLPSLSLLGL
jgi:DNA-binding YbaB/EbfC family protein